MSNLNALQVALFIGDEDQSLCILDFLASTADELNTRKFLFEFMGKLWGSGNTSLHLGSFLGLARVVRRLMELGANSNKRNGRKYKAVDCADDDETRMLFLEEIQHTNLHDRGTLDDGFTKSTGAQSMMQSNEPNINNATTPSNHSTITTPQSLAPSHHSKHSKPKKRVRFDDTHTLIALVKEGNVSEIERFVKAPMTFQITNHFGTTPLHWASEGGNLQLVRWIVEYHKKNPGLIESSRSVESSNGIGGSVKSMGSTMESGQSVGHSVESVETIETTTDSVSGHIDTTNSDSGSGHMDSIQALNSPQLQQQQLQQQMQHCVVNGLDLDSADCEGWTALHSAAAEGHLDIVKYLIEEGANGEAVTEEMESVVDVADTEHRRALKELIIQKKTLRQ